MNTDSLRQNKNLLLAQCELDRRQLSAALLELEDKTGWAQLGASAAMYAIPKLKIAMPILGLILPYILPGGRSSATPAKSGFFTSLGKGVRVAVKIGQKAALLGKGAQLISSRLRHS